mmetsp:Transcript_52082/g.134306  ORF Transcript_52082/g.134306 Transcript_52082/m.134306 type:complete len:306 (-) Transcript_52082:35-952(-)
MHFADVLEASILKQFAEARVAQGRLAEVQAEARAEETLHVRQRHGDSGLARLVGQEFPEAFTHLLQCSQWQCGHRSWPEDSLLLLLCAALLHHCLRTPVGHHMTIQVAKDVPPGDSELDNVADPAQGIASQEGQLLGLQGLCTRIPSTREDHVLAASGSKMGCGRVPHLDGVLIAVGAGIHKVSLSANKECAVLAALLLLDTHLPAAVADLAQAARVDARQVIGQARVVHFGVVALLLQGNVLGKALQQDAALWPHLINVEALNDFHDLRRAGPEDMGRGRLRLATREALGGVAARMLHGSWGAV